MGQPFVRILSICFFTDFMTTQDSYCTFALVRSTLARVTPMVKQWQGIMRNELTTHVETRVSFLCIHAYIDICIIHDLNLYRYSKMNIQDGIIWIVFANHINCHSVEKSQDL